MPKKAGDTDQVTKIRPGHCPVCNKSQHRQFKITLTRSMTKSSAKCCKSESQEKLSWRSFSLCVAIPTQAHAMVEGWNNTNWFSENNKNKTLILIQRVKDAVSYSWTSIMDSVGVWLRNKTRRGLICESFTLLIGV